MQVANLLAPVPQALQRMLGCKDWGAGNHGAICGAGVQWIIYCKHGSDNDSKDNATAAAMQECRSPDWCCVATLAHHPEASYVLTKLQ